MSPSDVGLFLMSFIVFATVLSISMLAYLEGWHFTKQPVIMVGAVWCGKAPRYEKDPFDIERYKRHEVVVLDVRKSPVDKTLYVQYKPVDNPNKPPSCFIQSTTAKSFMAQYEPKGQS